MSILSELFEAETHEHTLPNGKKVVLNPLTLEQLAGLDYGAIMAALQNSDPISSVSGVVSKVIVLSILGTVERKKLIEEAEVVSKWSGGLQIELFNEIWRISAIKEQLVGEFIGRMMTTTLIAAANLKAGMSALPDSLKSLGQMVTQSPPSNA